MDEHIFSGLEELGFSDISNLNIYKKKDSQASKSTLKDEAKNDASSFLYERTVTCPVCGSVFKAISVKTSAYKLERKDSDFFLRYSIVNPYFYDVWLCNSCGYAAMKSDFPKIRDYQIELVKSKITSKWRGKNYPMIYDANIAIERYKLSLLSYTVIESRASKKGINCLKLAWMHRLINDADTELLYLKYALEGLNDAYYNEAFPIYGMDRFTTMYLIGELNRRLGNNTEALVWLSKLITTPNINRRLKELARDQKDLIKEEEKEAQLNKEADEKNELENLNPNKKTGFFSKLFK